MGDMWWMRAWEISQAYEVGSGGSAGSVQQTID